MKPQLTSLVSLVALAACSAGAEVSATEAPAPTVAAAPVEVTPPVLDAQGRLLASGKRVAGLTLPRGLRDKPAPRREFLYETDVPVEKVLAYFGPLLFTTNVERIGAGAVYRNAKPIEERTASLSLDVSILPTSAGGTRVHIHDLPPPPVDGEALREARANGYRGLE